MRPEIGSGPFRPGTGRPPPYLAGREEEQDLFLMLLADLKPFSTGSGTTTTPTATTNWKLRLLRPAREVAEAFESQPLLSGEALEAAIRRGFGEDAGDDQVDATAQQFRHLGYIWRAGTRRPWEPGIPSLMDYILREVPAP